MRFVWWVIAWVVCANGYGAGPEVRARWEKTDEHLEEARSKEEFRDFQSRYPQYFAEEDLNQAGYAFVRRERFVYRGENTCAPGDARLVHEVVTHGACLGGGSGDGGESGEGDESGDGGEGQCFQAMSGDGLEDGDPCAGEG